MFDFIFVAGNRKTALNQPNQVVITDRIAAKYYGSENPIGKSMIIGAPYSDDEMELLVSGVIEEMPSNTHFHMNFLISMPTGKTVFSDNLCYNWGWDSHYTYAVLPAGYKADQFQSELIDFGEKYPDGEWFLKFFALKAEDIHLHSNLNSEIEANGSTTYVYIFFCGCLDNFNHSLHQLYEFGHRTCRRPVVAAICL